MTDRLAAVALRTLAPRAVVHGFADGDSLENINTSELPNGAECFVIENRTLYRLDKTSTAVPFGNFVVAPGSGPGRWIADSEDGILDLAAFADCIFSPTESIGADNTWQIAPSALYQLEQGLGFWELSKNNCILTYHGPPRKFSARILTSMTLADVGSQVMAAFMAKNGELIGDTADTFAQQQATITDTSTAEVVSERIVAMVADDTLQPIYKSTPTGTIDVTWQRQAVIIVPV